MTQEIASTSADAADFLVGGGEMGERIRAFDWSATTIGPVEQWPQSLLTLVGTTIRSRFPIVIWWNHQHYTTFYNDAYIPFLGKTKHPGWLGRSGRECWKEIWPTIGPMLESVFKTGQPTWSEGDLLLVLDRNLPHEEAYFTFSYSAILGANGVVDGIFCACTETTERVIGERQVKLLRTLAAETADARTIEEAYRLSTASLEYNPYDLPFAMLYLFDAERQMVYLADTSGISKDHEAVPQTVALDSPSFWPFADVLRDQRTCIVADLDRVFDNLPTGAWKRPPYQAVTVPIAPVGQTGKAGVLIVGLNPFRLFNESYQGFINLVAGQIAASIGNAQAYEEERKRAEALAEIDRAKTLFFSNISHEFRTPLTLMLGPIEDMLAENNPLSPEQREQTEILHRNALRLLKLVNALLDFSRIEAGRVQALYQPTDLSALTADLASSFRSAIEKAGMKLTVDCPPLTEAVYVDHEMWEKIILNLLSNAFKYTFEGEISVSMRQRAKAVEVLVKDTGVGIPAEELPHMFERFHRVKGTTGRTFEGTGIGLSLIQELVRLHGGTIRVSSTPGQGSTFTVSLPLGTAHLPQDRIATQRTGTPLAANVQFYLNEALGLLTGEEDAVGILPGVSLFSGERLPVHDMQAPRVLFADDNADMREYVSRLLRQRYSVRVVSNGRSALAAVKQFQPDLVLADIMMPGMDGFELLQALRADSETRTLPVILLSARAGEEAKIEGMEAGADDYLTKPFSARELLARIGAHLEMARIRKELLQQKDEFIGVASHELKTPVTSLKAYTQLLERRFKQAGDERSTELLQKMDAQLNKLTGLIEDLLDVTKIESGKLQFHYSSFDFNELIKEIVEETQRTTAKHRIVLELASPVTLTADRDRIGQVLTNLLTNAIKYSPEAGRILVKTTRKGKEVITSVQDFGIGILAEKQEHIFERFFRVEGEQQETYPGLGLGLYISAEFVKRHNGSIQVESEEGKGTTVSFSLPVAHAEVRNAEGGPYGTEQEENTGRRR